MILRAHNFLEHWEQSLKVLEYKALEHTISKEVRNILHTLINSYVALLTIHRDTLGGKFLFLPWLHLTEICKHVFGKAQRIIKDFSYCNFVYMIPKLCAQVRHTMQHFKINLQATAIGYVYTYMDTAKLNIVNLLKIPTQAKEVKINGEALMDTKSLLHLLGIAPACLCQSFHHSSRSKLTLLPFLLSLLRNSRTLTSSNNESGSTSNAGTSLLASEELQDDEPSHRKILQYLLEVNISQESLTERAMKKLDGLRCAGFAVDADKFYKPVSHWSANILLPSCRDND